MKVPFSSHLRRTVQPSIIVFFLSSSFGGRKMKRIYQAWKLMTYFIHYNFARSRALTNEPGRALCILLPSTRGQKAGLESVCGTLSAVSAATWQTHTAALVLPRHRCAPTRLQNEWFDVKVNQDSLGELKGTIVGNLPFTAALEYPSLLRPCFLFDSKRMLPQCLSSHLAFVVIYWAFLFGLKMHASFGKVKSGNFSWSLSLFLWYSLLPLWAGKLLLFFSVCRVMTKWSGPGNLVVSLAACSPNVGREPGMGNTCCLLQ